MGRAVHSGWGRQHGHVASLPPAHATHPQFMIVLFMINVVFSVVKGAVNAANKAGGDKKDDDWDSL
jgi:hypothetical protein